MRPSNFGDRYFTIRDQLASLMAGVAALARDVDLDPAESLPVTELRDGLARPFVFAAWGEVNAGKSAFLNALLGLPLSPTQAIPGPSAIRIYRGGAANKDTAPDGGVFHCLRVLDILRDFHLIDTPGLNTMDDRGLAMIRDHLAQAEIIFAILPVENPWGAPAWDFLAGLDTPEQSRVVLILQKADTRNTAELRALRGHIIDLCKKRLGHSLPVFAVSARQAMAAKQSSPLDYVGWRASGMAEIEEHLGVAVCQSPARWSLLSQWRDQAATTLKAIEDRMEDRARGLREHSRFLDEIEGEIDVMREKFVKRLPHHLAEVADVFENEADAVTRVLSRRLGVLRSVFRLFTRAKVGREIESLFIERLKIAVESVAHADAIEVFDYCKLHWKALAPRVEEALGIPFDGEAEMTAAMEQSRAAFVRRLGTAAGAGFGGLSMRRHLDADLRLRQRSLNSFAMATLLLTTFGAICGGLNLPWIPWILLGLAGLFLIGGLIAATVTRRTIVRSHRHALIDVCGRFASTLRGDYEEALRLIFRDYAQCLRVVREYLVRESRAIEPRQRRWQEMLLHLKAIEQDL